MIRRAIREEPLPRMPGRDPRGAIVLERCTSWAWPAACWSTESHREDASDVEATAAAAPCRISVISRSCSVAASTRVRASGACGARIQASRSRSARLVERSSPEPLSSA
ncbi:hypothetical protein BE21_08585 [Sorangium cellulosum]|uniref:Uncharacterized protein n=1 Tax=Sorangium cellulosum TaxID=56 RepID=A0A150U2X0_SORCE|nr:hypothetical protein BE21_08585 [Sorangium cellulosum]